MSQSEPTLGERLKAERERRGLSTQKVADEMHLDAWVIDALEAGDYQRIGPTVYAKGHLKKYASLLGMSPALIATGYETKSAAPAAAVTAPSVVMRMPRAAPAPVAAPWPQIAAIVVIVAACGAIAWWRPWQQRSAPVRPEKQAASARSATSPHAPAMETAAGAAAPPSESRNDGASANETSTVRASPYEATTASAGGTPSAEDASQRTPGLRNVESGSAPPPAARAAASTMASPPAPMSVAPRSESAPSGAESMPGAGHARLRLSFSADSWVDVHDATGRRVFAGNGRANSVQTIAGTAPLSVYLGFASGVQLEVNDRVVAIAPQFVTGDVARFEAGADGVLRRETHPTPAQGAQPRTASPRG